MTERLRQEGFHLGEDEFPNVVAERMQQHADSPSNCWMPDTCSKRRKLREGVVPAVVKARVRLPLVRFQSELVAVVNV